MLVAVTDVETTGMDPETNSVVEIASVSFSDREWFSTLVKPEHRIEFQAMAVHMITEKMVSRSPPLEMVLDEFHIYRDAEILVFHNAEFDQGFLPHEDRPVICTWRCSEHLFPEAESHGNIALCFEFGLDFSTNPGEHSHRALFDAWQTTQLLEFMVETVCMDEEIESEEALWYLVELTKRPIIQKKVKFGKHKGQSWDDIPTSYLRWAIREEFDRDTIHTIEHQLTSRGVTRI